jgi:hypothetical protein
MSIESMAVVLHHAPFAGRDKLILLGIANHDGDGGAWPAIGTLAAYGNCSVSSVKRTLATLMEAGAIVRHIQAGGNRNTPEWARANLYEVKVECPPNCDRSRSHKPVDKDASNLWQPESNTAPPSSSEPRGSSVGEPRGSSVGEPLTIKEPPINHPDKSALVSTSPETRKVCWACGQLGHCKGSYCTGCESRGFNTPIIGCRHEGCELTTRRTFPGQQHFDCKGH